MSAGPPRGIRQSTMSVSCMSLDRGFVAHVVDEEHRVGGEPGFGQAVTQRLGDGDVGSEGRRRAPQERGVARLQADAGGVAGDVGPVLVDDRDHAERHPHPLDVQPVGAPPAVEHLADRVGQRGDGAQAGGHAVEAGLGEAEPVEGPGLHAGGLGGLDVEPVGGEELGGPVDQEVGGGEQRGVLRRRSTPPRGRRMRPSPGGPAHTTSGGDMGGV